MPNQLPPALQERIETLQQLEKELLTWEMQVNQLKYRLNEIEQATNELNKLPADKKTYKMTNFVLVETEKDILFKELDEKKELADFQKSRAEKMLKQKQQQFSKLEKQVKQELTEFQKNLGNFELN